MPRLFTGIEIPPEIGFPLSSIRGGLPGARWIDPENYHMTLRFMGDVDDAVAADVHFLLADLRRREPIVLTIDGLAVFGGDKPRALLARIVQTQAILDLQAEQERLLRRIGLSPETRKFIPHVTLARLRDVSSAAVADHLAVQGHLPKLSFTVKRFVLYSSRASVGGGPYVIEAEYPLTP